MYINCAKYTPDHTKSNTSFEVLRFNPIPIRFIARKYFAAQKMKME